MSARSRFARKAVKLRGNSPVCGRKGCRHQRVQHYVSADTTQHCGAVLQWPYTDRETGVHVQYQQCQCSGFTPSQ